MAVYLRLVCVRAVGKGGGESREALKGGGWGGSFNRLMLGLQTGDVERKGMIVSGGDGVRPLR